jgi:hypothetical protein
MTAERPVRTYGGWRRARGLGLGRLGPAATAALCAGVVAACLTTVTAGMTPGLAVATVVMVALGAGSVHRDGITLPEHVTAAVAHRVAVARGHTAWRGHALSASDRPPGLPGVLASTTLLPVTWGNRDQTAGVVWDRRTGSMSATLLLSGAGTLLCDPTTAEGSVAGWAGQLAALADTPAVRSLTVTVQSVPDPGTGLAVDHANRVLPDAPATARAVLAELAATAPAAGAVTTVWLTANVDPDHPSLGARCRDPHEAAARTLRLVETLDPTPAGAALQRVATPGDLVSILRHAYDPHTQTTDDDHDPRLLADDESDEWGWLWAQAGPVGAEEDRDCYRHDGATSVSWALVEAPRTRVGHNVLLPLLAPGIYARRVSLCYRILDRDAAGRLLDREQTAATARAAWRARTRRDTDAREHRDHALTLGAAAEEAAGAGLALFTMFVTTTVTDPTDLQAACAEVATAAAAARVRLRLARFGQAAAFTVGLPAGYHPANPTNSRRWGR